MRPFIFLTFALGVFVVSFLGAATQEFSCPREGIPCDDGSCIHRVQWCDKTTNCPDESDEKYCEQIGFFTSSDPNGCDSTHFKCEDGICFPPSVKCDGIEDCLDKSDEHECYTKQNFSRVIMSTSEVTSSAPRSFYPVEEDIPYPHQNARTNWLSPQEIPQVPSSIAHGYRPQQVLNTARSHAMGEQWLLTQHHRNKDAARVLIALALSNPKLLETYNKEISLMKKQFQMFMAEDMLRYQSQKISRQRLALYINAMLATCQDPHNFNGIDLVKELRQRTTDMRNRDFINPIIYLALCNANQSETNDGHMLRTLLFPDSQEQRWLDMQAISIMALSCFVHSPQCDTDGYKRLLDNVVLHLIKQMADDGSFGNIYSTALAVQALLSANAHDNWNSELSFQFLQRHQQPDGSFGDTLATYYVMPILVKKSLADLRNVTCSSIKSGYDLLSPEILKYARVPKHYIHYSLRMGDPLQVSYSIMLHVSINATFFNVMKIAQNMDPKFRFQYETEGDVFTVYSISGIPNDPETGMYWNLYQYPDSLTEVGIDLQKHYLKSCDKDILSFIPSAENHMVFWYHPL